MDFWTRLYNLLPQPVHGYLHSALVKLSSVTGFGWVKFVPPVTVPMLAVLIIILALSIHSANLRQKATP